MSGALRAAMSLCYLVLVSVQASCAGHASPDRSRVISTGNTPASCSLRMANSGVSPIPISISPPIRRPPAFLPNPEIPLTVDDLQGAVRAEATMIIWGGHISTYGKKVRFNGNAWIDLA